MDRAPGRVPEPDPRPETPQSRDRMRSGHRREWRANRARGSTSFAERCAQALADIGVHGVVSFRDLAVARFGGHPYTTRRAVNAWIRDGLVAEHVAVGPRGNPFKALALTRAGVAEARRVAVARGMNPRQVVRSARVRTAEAAHDASVYRACMKERLRLEDRGASIRRIRLDAELKGAVARTSETARRKDGKNCVDARGRVLYPDAQIEYVDTEGRAGRVNVEIVSGNYRESAVRAKADAGFSLHASGPTAARLLGRLGIGGEDGSRVRGSADRDPATVEL